MANRYQVLGLIGEGGAGAVYRADRIGEGLSRPVALKVLLPGLAGTEALEQRLRDEARMLSMIHHRSIVGVDDLIVIDGRPCLVMEYVPGEDVAAILARAPIPPRAALEVAVEVASALNVAYEQPGPDGAPLRLIHRDIKPANIRVTPQGEVKLLDFGIARAEFAAREAKTMTLGFGSMLYLAPERLDGVNGPAADVYSLGVTLFEMICGRPPGTTSKSADRAPPGRNLRSLWEQLARLNSGLVPLLADMLAEDPKDRPSAKEVARAVGRIVAMVDGPTLAEWAGDTVRAQARWGTPTREESALAVGRSIDAGSTPPEGPAPPAPATSPKVRWWLPVGLAVSVFFLVFGASTLGLLGVGAWQWSRSGTTTETPAKPPSPVAPAATPTPSGTTTSETPTTPAAPVTTAPSRTTPATSKTKAPTTTAEPTTKAAPVATTTPTPAPQAAAPATPAAAPAASSMGTLLVSGDATSVSLTGPSGAVSPGPVPPGTYSATAIFASGAKITKDGIVVRSDRKVSVRCLAAFSTCTVSTAD